MKCFYHKSDLDGHCAGAIVRKHSPGCEMIGVDYNDRLDKFHIVKDEKVFVVDFSFSPTEMVFLNEMADLVWIDHHKSAIEPKWGQGLKGFRHDGFAGCELTWNYLFGGNMPQAVYLLGRYDVWDHTDPAVLEFRYGMQELEDTRPTAAIWDVLLGEEDVFTKTALIANIRTSGKTILRYQKKQDAMYAAGMAYETEFEGYRAIVMNKPYANSKAFDTVYDPEKHDIMVLFGVKPGEYKYSLYSTKPDIDVSAIAAKYGGGGHAGAAGFYLKTAVL